MRKNLVLMAILAVVVVVVAISGCSNNNNTTNVSALNEQSTKLNIVNNNPNVWLHIDLDNVNVTLKNGTNVTFYIEAFVQPGDNLTIDLSNLMGYGNEKLPPNTTIRIQSWKGLYMNTTDVGIPNTQWNGTVGSDSYLNLTLQGWSNTWSPGPNDPQTNLTFSPMPVYPLVKNITRTCFFVSSSLNPVNLDWTDNDTEEPVYEEEILFVDENGRVTINVTVPPELCNVIADII